MNSCPEDSGFRRDDDDYKIDFMALLSTPRKQRKPPKKITPSYLHNAGLTYLQKFASSSRNFERVLMRKVKKSCTHYTDQDYETCLQMVAETVKKFERAGLLNDTLYAEGMASSLRRGGKSKKSIIQKMTHKGLANDTSRKALQDFDEREHGDSADSEFNAALKFARKKKLETKALEKALAAFARAGFSYDVARKILSCEIPEE
jgi:regulatory protein